jgi:alpha-beta hydrolase superfamily lysophospholipase
LPVSNVVIKGEAVRSSTFTLASTDGVALFVYCWLPEAAPKAAVQIVHGFVEHAGRYVRLAKALTRAGYAVYAGDHRGHGRTAPTPEDLGFFAERDGWRKCIDDLWALNQRIAADLPGLPIVLVGHSLGSFMAQHFISEHGEALSGVVLAGSTGKPTWLTVAVRIIAGLERLRLGQRGRSSLVHSLVFGIFNKQFEPVRAQADWLSRDSAEVDKYIADPLCGFRPTVQLWIDLLDALGEIAKPARRARIPRHLPMSSLVRAILSPLAQRWERRSLNKICRPFGIRQPLVTPSPDFSKRNQDAAQLSPFQHYPPRHVSCSPVGGIPSEDWKHDLRIAMAAGSAADSHNSEGPRHFIGTRPGTL